MRNRANIQIAFSVFFGQCSCLPLRLSKSLFWDAAICFVRVRPKCHRTSCDRAPAWSFRSCARVQLGGSRTVRRRLATTVAPATATRRLLKSSSSLTIANSRLNLRIGQACKFSPPYAGCDHLGKGLSTPGLTKHIDDILHVEMDGRRVKHRHWGNFMSNPFY